MKNNKKKFLNSLFFSLVFVPSLTFISAETDSTVTTPKPERKKSPQFDTFAPKVKTALENGFSQAIDVAISNFEQDKKQLEQDENIDYKTKLQTLYYLETLINFIKSNKANIAQNPKDFDFNVIFPNVFSKKENFQKGDVSYNGILYENVIFTSDPDDTNYKPLISSVNGKQESKTTEINGLVSNEVDKYIKQYVDGLKNKFGEILFNQKDIPETINFKSEIITTPEGKTVSIIKGEPPSGFNSWEDYFKSKYKSRFLTFDLEQNKIDEEEIENEEVTDPEKPTNEIPDIPPIEENDDSSSSDVVTGQPFNPKQFIERLRVLAPEILSRHAGKSINQLMDDFNTTPISEDFFFFNNPINTRFKYEVTKIEDKTNEAINSYLVTVRIQDSLNPKVFRTYKTYLNKLEDKNFQKVNESYIENIRKIFVKLYKSIGLDEKMDFDKLENADLKRRIITMINVVTQDLYYTKDFVEKQSKIISKISKNINSLKQGLDVLNVQLLSSLKTSRIQFKEFFAILPEGYKKQTQRFEQLLSQQKELSDNIKEKFKKYNANLDIVNKLFSSIKKDISLIQKLANAPTTNTNKWYENYLKLQTKISRQFNLIKSFLKDETKPEDKNPKKDEIIVKNEKDFSDNYILSQELLKNNLKSQNIFLTVISSILSLVGISGVSFVVWDKLQKKQANKTLLKSNLSILILSIAIIIIALILITIGIVGGI
ncbi:MSC_0620 family F1-like ATPase-associated subunit [Mesomycoplasma molare]|uniref:Uncharacterized protein n=1 Tax=Mesomycoplasma molare TaxID=171288 RepID=A0ABY5TT63_9BACT|nr:hypothetical protein [Mesomycoplasma molare]UWD33875.1 hypothetical protein NX772_02070 [Mesomycoplasma molare]